MSVTATWKSPESQNTVLNTAYAIPHFISEKDEI
jgi:hypothetical protein